MCPFRILEHTADIGLEIKAPDLPSLFCDAAEAMYSVITDPESLRKEWQCPAVESRQGAFQTDLRAENLPDLFQSWMRELLYRFSSERLILLQFHFYECSETRIAAEGQGLYFSPSRHDQRTEVKAVTRHGYLLKQENGIWCARLILDI